jgi:hypothetical protein
MLGWVGVMTRVCRDAAVTFTDALPDNPPYVARIVAEPGDLDVACPLVGCTLLMLTTAGSDVCQVTEVVRSRVTLFV